MLPSRHLLEVNITGTTSLKLPDTLKATIAKVAAFEGKTAHALMVDTLQAAMEDALARQQALPLNAAKPMNPAHD